MSPTLTIVHENDRFKILEDGEPLQVTRKNGKVVAVEFENKTWVTIWGGGQPDQFSPDHHPTHQHPDNPTRTLRRPEAARNDGRRQARLLLGGHADLATGGHFELLHELSRRAHVQSTDAETT